MANNTITLATLDFDSIKDNLKNHMRSQEIFKDYNFDGANINVLLSVLAYNTSLNAYYANMLASESFLDSAQLRSSVVSHAKELNYCPRSATSAVATIILNAEQNNSNVLTIPKGTTFTASFNFQTFSFSTDSVKVFFAALDPVSKTYKFKTDAFNIYEGFYVTETFVMDYTNETQRFVLSNDMIDTSSLVVNSIEDGGSSTITYTLAESLLGLTSQSTRYFVQATEQSNYELIFGDDILGRKPKDGSVINVQYRISSGSIPNGASVFTIDSDITTDNSGRLSTITSVSAIGGDEPESISSIKYNAPRHFQTQERAVADPDYEDLFKVAYPEIEAVSVYGGETTNPPAYGKVFIALSISGVDGLPESKKQEYYNFIKPKMVGPIQPVFVNPSYLYCRIDTNVEYNLNVTNLKPEEIKLLVSAKILGYDNDNLNDFNSTLYTSRLTRTIDDAHASIVANDTECRVYKKIVPTLGVVQNIDVKYGLALRSDIPEVAAVHPAGELTTLYSSPFTYNGAFVIIEDNGVGGLRMMSPTGTTYTKVKDIGTIDYASGTLQLINLSVDAFDGNSIRLYALPATKNITSAKNDIFRLEMNEVNIEVEAVRQ